MPNRILKESICTSDSIDSLSFFHETVFYRLLVNCDDYGRLDARAKILKAKLFPLKDIPPVDIEVAIKVLADADLIILYDVGDKSYIQVKTWEKHQQVRAKKSKYPPPPAGICNQMKSDDSRKQADDSKCPRNPIQSNPNTNPNPKEEGEKAGASPAPADPPSAADMSAAQYCDMCLRGMSPGNYEELRSFADEDGLPDDLIKFAVDDACGHGKRAWSYVSKILNRYVVEGIRTVDQARAGRKDAEAANGNQPPQAAKGWGGDL